MVLRRAALGAVVTIGLLFALAGAALANSAPAVTTFANVVRSSPVAVLVGVHARSDGGYTLDVERVLKGSAPARLQVAPTLQAALEAGWSRAIVAFSDVTTLDFRAPTIAWHVSADGRIDPEGYQQYRGLPQTLGAMLAWFDGVPATDTVGLVTPAPVERSPLISVVILLGLTGLIAGVGYKRPST